MSETNNVLEKAKNVPEVVENEISLTKIPQMNSSELKELSKSPQKSSETKNSLTLSEIPMMSTLKQSEKKESENKKQIIPEVIEETPNKAMLTEIPKMVPNHVEKNQNLQIEHEDSNHHESEDFIAIPSQKGSNKPQNSKKKVIVTNVIEETTNPNTNSLEGSLFIPDTPKTEVKSIKLPNSQEESSNEEDDAIFMLKKPSVKLEEIKTESIKTTRSDLFNVFSSIPDHDTDDNVIGTEALSEIDKTEDTEDNVKKSKKKDKKKEKSKKDEKISKQGESTFRTKVPPEESSTIDYDNLPNNKEILYQDLIALEGKRYSIEKAFKELEIRLTNRNINENDFRKQSNDLTSKLKEISSNITKLRNAIAKL